MSIRTVALAPSSFWPHRGGVEEVSDQLGRELSRRGRNVSVTTMRWPKSLPRREYANGLSVRRQIFRAHTGGLKQRAVAATSHPLTLGALVAHYRQFRPDVINVHCVSGAALFHAQAAQILGIPLVVSLHGELTMDASRLFQRDAAAQRVLRKSLAVADGITACSHETMRDAQEWFGQSLADRSAVIHNGVDVDFFRTSQPMQHPAPYIFAVGRHVPQKGFDVLVSAFERISSETPELDLVVAGEGAETARLKAAAASSSAGSRVHFVGGTNRSETARWLRGAIAAAMPSRQEPFGIVALEAMAAGTPIVASAVGGIPEFVRNERNGLLVAPNNPGALAVQLLRVVTDTDLRRHLADQAGADVDEFRWEGAAERYLDAYSNAVSYHGGRRHGIRGRSGPSTESVGR